MMTQPSQPSVSLLSSLAPYDLGLPTRFDSFRRQQVEAVEWIVGSSKRVLGAALPTGSGKSLIALAAAQVLGVRTAILTSTKGLMEQYMEDAAGLGAMEVKGKGNYRCVDKPGASCRLGGHEGCRVARSLGCSYEAARWEGKCARVVLTNYAYWVRVNERGRGLELGESEGKANPFGLLVLDESHGAVEELGKALQVTLYESVMRAAGVAAPKTEDIGELAEWAVGAVVVAGEALRVKAMELRQHPHPPQKLREQVGELEGLEEGLGKVVGMRKEWWVCELRVGTEWGRVWVMDCVWPGALAEQRLMLGVPKVLMMSATLRPASMKMLGVELGEGGEGEFREWPRVWPAQNTQVLAHVSYSKIRKTKEGKPAPIGLNYQTSDEDWDVVIENVDRFIDKWKGVKGLVHTGSYERQRRLMEKSRWRGVMIGNTQDPESDTAMEAAERWRRAEAPCVLVSPSFSTGWNFPGGGWIVFLKVPLKPRQGKVVEERLKRMPGWLDYQAMQDLVQGAGRLTRAEGDRTTVVVMDSNVFWFMNRNKGMKPGWFQVREVRELPGPRGQGGGGGGVG